MLSVWQRHTVWSSLYIFTKLGKLTLVLKHGGITACPKAIKQVKSIVAPLCSNSGLLKIYAWIIMLFETFTLCILGIYSCHNACHFYLIMPASPYSIMGNCCCRRRPRIPEQSTAEEQYGPVELILIGRNCLAQAHAGSSHSVLVTSVKESTR